MERVKVYNEKGMAVETGTGIFARIFMENFPRLPVADEESLQGPMMREKFIERILAQKR
jgi:uncharacterized protein YbbK (DUF523 family)